MKNSKYVKIDSINPLQLIIGKMNGYFEYINGNICLTLAPTNENKEIMKKGKVLCNKVRDLIRPISKNSGFQI